MTIRSHLWNAKQFIYLVEGPGGCYVGCTTNPERRWKQHLAKTGPGSVPHICTNLLIHDLMRHYGRERYSFRIVGTAREHRAGERAEYALVRQLRAEGKRVVNVFPRTPLHVGGFRGRFVGVVVNGRVEPLFPLDANNSSEPVHAT